MEYTSTASSPMQTDHNVADKQYRSLDLATDGDVIMILGSTTLEGIRAMFSLGRFSEGSGGRSASNPKEVNLPDDDERGMILLFKVIHHRSIEDDVAPGLLADDELPLEGVKSFDCTKAIALLAILADKYDCTQVVKGPVSMFVTAFADRVREDHFSTDRIFDITAAAYTLHLNKDFAQLTRDLVLYHTAKFSTFMLGGYGDLLPPMTFILLEEQRTFARKRLGHMLAELETIWCSEIQCGVIWDSGFNAWLSEISADGDTLVEWIDSTYLGDLFSHLWDLRDFGSKKRFRCAHVGATPTVDHKRLTSICYKVNRLARGLCLPCLKKGTHLDQCAHSCELELNASIAAAYVYGIPGVPDC